MLAVGEHIGGVTVHIGGVHIGGVHNGEARCSAPRCTVLHMVGAAFEQS